MFRQFAMAVLLAAIFFLAGIRVVNTTSSALPGERLYLVKRTWENSQQFFALNGTYRQMLTQKSTNERLKEIYGLLEEEKPKFVRFAGSYQEEDGGIQVSDVLLVMRETSLLASEPLENDRAVLVEGQTNSNRCNYVRLIGLLPPEHMIPTAWMIESRKGQQAVWCESNNLNASFDSNLSENSGSDNSMTKTGTMKTAILMMINTHRPGNQGGTDRICIAA